MNDYLFKKKNMNIKLKAEYFHLFKIYKSISLDYKIKFLRLNENSCSTRTENWMTT